MNNILNVLSQHSDWTFAQIIIKKLKDNGFDCLLAGGCVRDAIIGRPPNDIDIATNALPDQVEKLFENTIIVGKQFGVIVVYDKQTGQQIEVTTFRKDEKYVDGRRPEKITFSTPEMDAERRDFTINALFYDIEKNEVIDYVGGVQDIKQKIIKTVGEASLRFQEDHLRLLRAFRFKAQLGFEIDSTTLIAISKHKGLIASVSSERVTDEFLKLLAGEYILEALRLEEQVGLIRFWLQSKLSDGIDSKLKFNENFIGQLDDLFKDRTKEKFKNKSPKSTTQLTEKEAVSDWQNLALFLSLYVFPESFSDFKKINLLVSQFRVSKEFQDNIVDYLKLIFFPDQFFALRFGEQLIKLKNTGYKLGLEHLENLAFKKKKEKIQSYLKEFGNIIPEPILSGKDLKAEYQGKRLGEVLHSAYLQQLENKWSSKKTILNWVISEYKN